MLLELTPRRHVQLVIDRFLVAYLMCLILEVIGRVPFYMHRLLGHLGPLRNGRLVQAVLLCMTAC